jgi:hypothetical protein
MVEGFRIVSARVERRGLVEILRKGDEVSIDLARASGW